MKHLASSPPALAPLSNQKVLPATLLPPEVGSVCHKRDLLRMRSKLHVRSALIEINMEFVRAVRKLDSSGSAAAKEKLRQEELEKWGIKNVVLRPYQLEGVSWLTDRLERGHGCILGDEMGLGKTLQVAPSVDGSTSLSRQRKPRVQWRERLG